MRVISGSARGHKLQSVPGNSTRPITDRAKEALFSILGNWIEGRHVLDLFGGTGAVGIEALSRGAAHVHFIDLSRAAIRTILKTWLIASWQTEPQLRGGTASNISKSSKVIRLN